MAQFRPGELVWLLPWDEAPTHRYVDRSSWNRAVKRNPHKVGYTREDWLAFQGGYVRWPLEAFVSADSAKIKPVEVGDLL